MITYTYDRQKGAINLIGESTDKELMEGVAQCVNSLRAGSFMKEANLLKNNVAIVSDSNKIKLDIQCTDNLAFSKVMTELRDSFALVYDEEKRQGVLSAKPKVSKKF